MRKKEASRQFQLAIFQVLSSRLAIVDFNSRTIFRMESSSLGEQSASSSSNSLWYRLLTSGTSGRRRESADTCRASMIRIKVSNFMLVLPFSILLTWGSEILAFAARSAWLIRRLIRASRIREPTNWLSVKSCSVIGFPPQIYSPDYLFLRVYQLGVKLI